MDDLAKKIIETLDEAIAKYGSEFDRTDISISVDRGYSKTDPWLVKYSIGNYNNATEGAYLNAAVAEYMRRKGWTEANKPMVLIENKADEPVDNDN